MTELIATFFVEFKIVDTLALSCSQNLDIQFQNEEFILSFLVNAKTFNFGGRTKFLKISLKLLQQLVNSIYVKVKLIYSKFLLKFQFNTKYFLYKNIYKKQYFIFWWFQKLFLKYLKYIDVFNVKLVFYSIFIFKFPFYTNVKGIS